METNFTEEAKKMAGEDVFRTECKYDDGKFVFSLFLFRLK